MPKRMNVVVSVGVADLYAAGYHHPKQSTGWHNHNVSQISESIEFMDYSNSWESSCIPLMLSKTNFVILIKILMMYSSFKNGHAASLTRTPNIVLRICKGNQRPPTVIIFFINHYNHASLDSVSNQLCHIYI